MNICPICEAKLSASVCPSCGADLTVDYENYPTFCDVSGMKTPMSAAKKRWISLQRSDMLICEKCGSTSFRYYKNDNLHTCLRCGWKYVENSQQSKIKKQELFAKSSQSVDTDIRDILKADTYKRSSSLYIGQMLDNKYKIVEKIGAGGMAVVYKAMNHKLNRLVAIKVLRNDLAQDESVRRRFRAESRAVAMMSHPNIVGIYDVCRTDGLEYIVMELIEGITLKKYIARKKILTWKETLHFAIQITRALAHAHSRGMIHGGIRPNNIMILKDGTAKVADFGITRVLNVQNTILEKTAFDLVHYMSPEQARGSHVDKRSDLYSVGVVMYQMLTGTLPFHGDTPVSVALAHINSIPPLPSAVNPNVPAGLEDITMHAMDPHPDMRYSSAAELLKDLEEFRKNPNTVFDFTVKRQNYNNAEKWEQFFKEAGKPSNTQESTSRRKRIWFPWQR